MFAKVFPTDTLQDDDKINIGNYSAGLLSELIHKNKRKTRVCSDWLEARDFDTAIVERRFNTKTVHSPDEPLVALCGFDNAKSRSFLGNAGFKLVAEAGLGGEINDFDRITFHSFPDASKTPGELWGNVPEGTVQHENVRDAMEKAGVEQCGAVEIAGKSISVSFVGACAAAIVVAELVRAANGGPSYEVISLYLRALRSMVYGVHPRGKYSAEIVPNGLLDVTAKRNKTS